MILEQTQYGRTFNVTGLRKGKLLLLIKRRKDGMVEVNYY